MFSTFTQPTMSIFLFCESCILFPFGIYNKTIIRFGFYFLPLAMHNKTIIGTVRVILAYCMQAQKHKSQDW